jgi:hypothetical protein
VRTRYLLEDLQSALNVQCASIYARLDRIDAKMSALETGLAEWRPQVHLSDEQLEKILATREPLSIPEHAGELVREIARYGGFRYMQHLGYGSFITADWQLNPDGTIALELQEPNGTPFWRGIFCAP